MTETLSEREIRIELNQINLAHAAGGQSALDGLSIDDNPYYKLTHPKMHEAWDYMFLKVKGDIRRGELEFLTTDTERRNHV